jgi:hypothetical protein
MIESVLKDFPEYSISQAIVVLRDEHNIHLTNAGLRNHMAGRTNKRALPECKGTFHADWGRRGLWTVTPAQLDEFAAAFHERQKHFGRLGRSGAKRA